MHELDKSNKPIIFTLGHFISFPEHISHPWGTRLFREERRNQNQGSVSKDEEWDDCWVGDNV